jgi:cytoskeletal protein CcmA (bactofilin family)
MALWKEQAVKEPSSRQTDKIDAVILNTRRLPQAHDPTNPNESLIASNLTIEGKIDGVGHVRIAGCFKGDVCVEGNLTIEPGARLMGDVHADTIIIAGELHGNIYAAARVELVESGLLIGDLNASTVIVAAGSRMRGSADFGWEKKTPERLDVDNRPGTVL